jgi:hypothetical protein
MVITASKTMTSVQVFLFTEFTRTPWWDSNIFSLAFGLVVIIQELLEHTKFGMDTEKTHT